MQSIKTSEPDDPADRAAPAVEARPTLTAETGAIRAAEADRGTIAPAAMCGGGWCGLVGFAAVVAAVPLSRTLVNQQERDMIADFSRKLLGRLTAYRSPSIETAEVTHAI